MCIYVYLIYYHYNLIKTSLLKLWRSTDRGEEISAQLRLQLIASILSSIAVPHMLCADLALVLWEGAYYMYIVRTDVI